MKKIFGLLITAICLQTTKAQEFIIKNGFHGFLDNREYFNKYSNDQTFFGNHLYSFGNFSFENYEINVGCDYTYEFGSLKNSYKPKLIASYYYFNKKIEFKIGSFHRRNYLNYPVSLLTDSLDYYRPLIEGTLFRYNFKNGFQQVWLDWTGRQTDTIRETFLAGLSGQYNLGNFYLKNYIIMYHHALPGHNIHHLQIRDNGGASVIAGNKFKFLKIIDSLDFKAGEILVYDRHRGVYDFKYYTSTMIGLDVYIKRFLFSAIYTAGDGLEVMYGEKIYRAPHYARFDLGYMPFKNRSDNIIKFSVHYVEGKINYSQLINIFLQFDVNAINYNKSN